MPRVTALVVALILLVMAGIATAQPPIDPKYKGIENNGRYYHVIKGHDIAGTGTFSAGLASTFSPEDWVVGTAAYQGAGGPTAIRVLDEGVRAPMGITPTEQTGNVLVKEPERWPLAVDDCWNLCRLGTCCMPGSVTAYCVLGCELHRLRWVCDPMPQNLYVDVGPLSQLRGKLRPGSWWGPCHGCMRPGCSWCAAAQAVPAKQGCPMWSPCGGPCAVCGRVGVTPLIDCWDVAAGYRAVCPHCAANWPAIPRCP